jgi:hypothetical protein
MFRELLLVNERKLIDFRTVLTTSGLKTLEERLLNDLAEQRNLIKTLQAQIAEVSSLL